MKYECDMIADLLPLYKDGVCSESSIKAIEDHLAECPSCKDMLSMLSDNKIDEEMIKEREEVIESQSKLFKRKSAVAGSIVAAVFAIPILVCLIVNLVNGSGLGWFFIVLAAMFIPTSLIVVPLMVPKYKMLYTMCSFTFSVILLLGTCCLYTKGNWFLTAASSVFFGLTVAFGPFIVARRPVRAYLGNFKGLILMGAYTLTFATMLLCIGLTVKTPGFFGMAFGISAPLLGVAWIVFLIIRYLPVNGLMKAGAAIAAFTLSMYGASYLMAFLLREPLNPNEVQVTSYPQPIGIVIGLVLGAIFFIIGLLTWRFGGKKNENA